MNKIALLIGVGAVAAIACLAMKAKRIAESMDDELNDDEDLSCDCPECSEPCGYACVDEPEEDARPEAAPADTDEIKIPVTDESVEEQKHSDEAENGGNDIAASESSEDAGPEKKSLDVPDF